VAPSENDIAKGMVMNISPLSTADSSSAQSSGSASLEQRLKTLEQQLQQIKQGKSDEKTKAAKIKELALFVKQDLGFDLLDMATAVDWVKENRFELVYFFQKSTAPSEKFFVKVVLPREGEPSAPSLCGVYDSADWQERETYDLMGIKFEGHPDLRRILLWEGYPGWPLRKDYVHTPDIYDNGSEIGTPKPAGAK